MDLIAQWGKNPWRWVTNIAHANVVTEDYTKYMKPQRRKQLNLETADKIPNITNAGSLLIFASLGQEHK